MSQSGDAIAELENVYGFRKKYVPSNGDELTCSRTTDSADSVQRYFYSTEHRYILTTGSIGTQEISAFDPKTAQYVSVNPLLVFERSVEQINARVIHDQVLFHEVVVETGQNRFVQISLFNLFVSCIIQGTGHQKRPFVNRTIYNYPT